MTENLYCPRCSQPFTPETGYCRTCGLSLDGVREIVTGEAASAPVMITRPNFKAFRYGIGIFIFGMVIGLLNGALRDFELYPQVYGKMVFLVLIAIGMVTMGSGFVFPTKKYAKRKPAGASVAADSQVKLDTAQLVPQLNEVRTAANDLELPKDNREIDRQPAGSVTEHTTRNLH